MKFQGLGSPPSNYFHEEYRHLLKLDLPPEINISKESYPTSPKLMPLNYKELEVVSKLFGMVQWCTGYCYCTASLIKAWNRVYTSSNHAHSKSQIRKSEDLWQWSWMEIWLNVCHWPPIHKKEFIIITNFILIIPVLILDEEKELT